MRDPAPRSLTTRSTTLATVLMSVDLGSVAAKGLAAMVAEVVPELHRYFDYEEVSRGIYIRSEG